MKLSLSFLVSFCIFNVASAGLIKSLLKPILNPFNKMVEFLAGLAYTDATTKGTFVDELLGVACEKSFSFLGLGSMQCVCGGDAKEGNAYGLATCTTEYRCLKESTGHFCGDATIDGIISAGDAGLNAYVNTCFNLDAGLLDDTLADQDDYDLCVSVETLNGLKLDTCQATLRGEPCTCTVCASGAPSFTLDCSNVDLSPFPDTRSFFGPKLDGCALLDFTQLD